MVSQMMGVADAKDIEEYGESVITELKVAQSEAYLELFSGDELQTLVDIHKNPAFKKMGSMGKKITQAVDIRIRPVLMEASRELSRKLSRAGVGSVNSIDDFGGPLDVPSIIDPKMLN